MLLGSVPTIWAAPPEGWPEQISITPPTASGLPASVTLNWDEAESGSAGFPVYFYFTDLTQPAQYVYFYGDWGSFVFRENDGDYLMLMNQQVLNNGTFTGLGDFGSEWVVVEQIGLNWGVEGFRLPQPVGAIPEPATLSVLGLSLPLLLRCSTGSSTKRRYGFSASSASSSALGY